MPSAGAGSAAATSAAVAHQNGSVVVSTPLVGSRGGGGAHQGASLGAGVGVGVGVGVGGIGGINRIEAAGRAAALADGVISPLGTNGLESTGCVGALSW